jgi:hypothetical protein
MSLNVEINKNNKFYLEVKEQRGGLLQRVESENITICTFNANFALNFTSKYYAKKFINKNNLNKQFKVICL